MDTNKTSTEQKKILISDIEINNENTALTVMIGILNLVQKRGGLTMEESAKVWECVSFFKSKSLISFPSNKSISKHKNVFLPFIFKNSPSNNESLNLSILLNILFTVKAKFTEYKLVLFR